MKTISDMRRHLISCGYNHLMVDVFLAFHHNNRHVWTLYQKKALELVARGATRLSSKAIFEKLREDADLKTQGGGEFKLTNTYTAYYARCFAAAYPQYAGMFDFKPVNLKRAA